MNHQWESVALWPDAISLGVIPNESIDSHYTREQAEAVCDMLYLKGNGEEKKEIIVEKVANSIVERDSGSRQYRTEKSYDGVISADKKYITVNCSRVSREKVKEVYEKMFKEEK